LCEKIPISEQRQIRTCFEVAKAIESDCAKLRKANYRDLCFSYKKICEKVQESTTRDSCWQLAIKERWKSLGFEPALATCKSITDQTNKENCLVNLLYELRNERMKIEAFKVTDELTLSPEYKWDFYAGILSGSLKPGQAPDPELCKELEKRMLAKPFPGCPISK
jgi:hypothetical protein